MGEPCPPDGQLERYIGPPLHVSFSDRFGAGSPKIARAIELYRERFSATGVYENKVYAGIPETLRKLKELSAALFVATSKPTTFAERIVEHSGLDKHIITVFGGELDGTRSDKAQLIAHIVKARAIDPCTTYMVGDREHDMRGARANGIAGIGALWGYGSREELLSAGAAALCEHPPGLREILPICA